MACNRYYGTIDTYTERMADIDVIACCPIWLFPSSLVVVVSTNCAYLGARFGSRRSKGIRVHKQLV